MIRSMLIAAVVYSYGHPCFDGYRPAAVDRALQAFHFDVTQLVRGGTRAVDHAVTMQELKSYADRAETQFRSAF